MLAALRMVTSLMRTSLMMMLASFTGLRNLPLWHVRMSRDFKTAANHAETRTAKGIYKARTHTKTRRRRA